MTKGNIAVDGKFYQKCKVVKLATNLQSQICINKHDKLFYSESLKTYSDCTNQFLYVLSNEKIEGKGYRMDMERMSVGVIDDDIYYNQYPERFKKIIASNNPELKIETELEAYYRNGIGGAKLLPHPSNIFLKAYCDQGGIDEVLVEYIPHTIFRKDGCPFCLKKNGFYQAKDEHGTETLDIKDCVDIGDCKLKVAPDNTITIKPVKNNWTREEMLKLCESAYNCGNSISDSTELPFKSFDEWVKENI